MKALLIFIATLAGDPTPAIVNKAIITTMEKCQAMAVSTVFIAGAKNTFEHQGVKPQTITGACVPVDEATMQIMNGTFAKP